MANRFWLGVSSDWTSTANWSTTRGGAGGSAAPTSSDAVFVYDGVLPITTNIGAVDVASLTIGGDFKGDIGTTATSMTLSCSGTFRIATVGKSFINIAATSTVATTYIDSTGSGRVEMSSGTFTNVYCGAVGTLIIDGSAVVTNLYTAGVRIVAAAGTAFTILQVLGGSGHETRRNVGTEVVANGGITHLIASAATAISVHKGGSIVHDSSGTITACTAYPGGSILAGYTPFTVTDNTIWEGATAWSNSGLITFTNAPTLIGRVGRAA